MGQPMKLLSLQTLISATLLALASHSLAVAATPSGSAMAEMSSFEGVVESERQTVMAAQVSGAVTEIAVKDRVVRIFKDYILHIYFIIASVE